MNLVAGTELGPEHREAYLALELDAARHYGAFAYDTPAQAREVHAALFDAGAGEGAARFAIAALEDGVLAGMFDALTGRELGAARLRAAMVLRKLGLLGAGSDVPERIKAAGGALWKVEAEDLYLARMAVAPAFRGRGLADTLMEALRTRAASEGRRLLLEVAAENEPARRLYTRHGFRFVEGQPASWGDRRLEMLLGERPA